ncbi:hypothetical protein ACFE04_017055 [Oxalis oulophora]
MALGIGCGGGEKVFCGNWKKLFDQPHCDNINCCPSMVRMVTSSCQRKVSGRVTAVASTCQHQSAPEIMQRQNLINNKGYGDDHDHQEQSHDKLDKWMRDSVVEIVKNLREAPLLLHVYGGDDDEELKVEKMVEEEIWPSVIAQRPEGVIFVEKLEEKEKEKESTNEVTPGEEEVVGVVVQGRGGRVGPACYLLKTNRVGPACHFCLVRVNSFRGTTAKQQFEDCWLVKNLMNNQSW